MFTGKWLNLLTTADLVSAPWGQKVDCFWLMDPSQNCQDVVKRTVETQVKLHLVNL